MKRAARSLLIVLLLVVCSWAFALASETSAAPSNADNCNDFSVENGYYYLIDQNGKMLCRNNGEVRTTEDYSAASVMYLCRDNDGYCVVFADDKRLLTMNTSEDTENVSFSAECWSGGKDQRFQLRSADDPEQYNLLFDFAHVIVSDDFTGRLIVAKCVDSNKQAWTIKKAETDFDALPMVSIKLESVDNWEDKEDVRYGQLTYSDAEKNICFTGEIAIGFQGHSSLQYPKKNYSIHFLEEGFEVVPEWGKEMKYCLKANYVDPTHSGNLVSADLAAQINKAYGLYTNTPNYGQVDGFPVWVTLNDKTIGLYTWNIPKTEWMLSMETDNPNHLLIGCEGWQEEHLMRDENYELGNQWSIEVGAKNDTTSNAFARLVHFVVTADDETFKQDVEKYLNLDACLNYCCYICISNATDNTSNNLLLATWDGEIWYPLLYDLDSCWGIRPGGLEPVYALVYSRDEYNCRLLERIRDLFPDELRKRYSELRTTVLNEENIKGALCSFVEQIPASYFIEDWQMWNPEGVYIQSLDLIQKRMAEYLPEVDEAFGYYG